MTAILYPSEGPFIKSHPSPGDLHPNHLAHFSHLAESRTPGPFKPVLVKSAFRTAKTVLSDRHVAKTRAKQFHRHLLLPCGSAKGSAPPAVDKSFPPEKPFPSTKAGLQN